MTYQLNWKSIPMPSIGSYVEDWYWPYLGEGVYMHVLATKQKAYVPHYIGQSKDMGRRWVEHVREYQNPPAGFYTPVDADAFLADPVSVFNENAVQQDLPGAAATWGRVLDASWFLFAEVGQLDDRHTLRHVEWCLQCAAIQHHVIEARGYIGDAEVGHGPPNVPLPIRNRFGRPFLDSVLPSYITFLPDQGIHIFDAD